MTRQDTPNLPIVLVVDDEALLRMSICWTLERAGFGVLEAQSANEALALLDGGADIRLIFTDVNMPGRLSGIDLAREVHSRRPDIRLLVTSGETRLTDDDIPDTGRFLPKPYDERRVVRMIDQMIRLSA